MLRRTESVLLIQLTELVKSSESHLPRVRSPETKFISPENIDQVYRL